jgi:hypothetical protein
VKPIEVRIPHGLDKAEVRQRLDQAVVKARDEYADQVGDIAATWQGDDRLDVTFTVMGMEIGSDLEILDQEILVRLELPGMVGMFAGRIREGITARLGGLLTGPAT